MTLLLFWIFALTACGGAVAVVVANNVVHMAFYLIVALGSVAGLFFLMGADFVGATQLLIYVGGTIVLLIFGVMLTGSGTRGWAAHSLGGERILAGIVGMCLLAIFGVSLLSVDWSARPGNTVAYADGGTTRPLGLELLGLDSQAIAGRPGDGVGFLLPFEVASMHLLVVLIGAAYLARAKRRSPEEDTPRQENEEYSPRMNTD